MMFFSFASPILLAAKIFDQMVRIFCPVKKNKQTNNELQTKVSETQKNVLLFTSEVYVRLCDYVTVTG